MTRDKKHPDLQEAVEVFTSKPLQIKQEATPADTQRTAAEREDRREQLKIARRLNTYTLIGIVLTVVNLGFVTYALHLNVSALRLNDASLKTSRQTLHIDQRAWLNASKISVSPMAIGKPLISYVVVANTGKTAATNILLQCSQEMPLSTREPSYQYQGAASIGMITPNDSTSAQEFRNQQANAPPLLTAEEVHSLSEGRGRSYVATFCKGSYLDIFKEKHWFRSCRPEVYYHGPSARYSYRSCTDYADTGDGDLPAN